MPRRVPTVIASKSDKAHHLLSIELVAVAIKFDGEALVAFQCSARLVSPCLAQLGRFTMAETTCCTYCACFLRCRKVLTAEGVFMWHLLPYQRGASAWLG